jgi:hypothetical protein
MEAFDAPDAPPFEPRLLVATPDDAWPQARVGLHPSLRALHLKHPVHDLRAAIARGETPRETAPQPTCVVVWRDAECFQRAVAIDPLACTLLTELRAGVPLGEACESIARSGGATEPQAFGPRLAEWFQQWTSRGWVSAVTFAL